VYFRIDTSPISATIVKISKIARILVTTFNRRPPEETEVRGTIGTISNSGPEIRARVTQHRSKQPAAINLTDAGRQKDCNDGQLEKAPLRIPLSRESDSNVNEESDVQPENEHRPRDSTEEGSQSDCIQAR
jgi:hypothetical protein